MSTSVDTVLRFYDTLGRSNVPAVLGLMDQQIEWTEAERFPYFGGIWRTPGAVLAGLLVPLTRDWATFAATPERFVSEGNSVVCFGRYTGQHRTSRRLLDVAFAHSWVVDGDVITRFAQYTDTAKVLDATRS